MSIKDHARDQGYSKEDEYFYKKDRELLAKLKEKSEASRKKLEEENKKREYWLRCPKCGSTLAVEKYEGSVEVDRCSNSGCGGVYFDGGELEILLRAKPGLFKRIFGG